MNDTRPEPQVIQVPTLIINLSLLGFHRFASEFLRTAGSFESAQAFSPVPYYLFCHSIELFLKAFLLTENVSKKYLKQRLGHDLAKALEKAKELGLEQVIPITPEQERELQKASAYYKSKDFEYFEVINNLMGYPGLPDLRMLEELASALAAGLESVCLSA